MAGLIHDLWMLDFDNGIGFLKHKENFSEILTRQNYSRFPLVKEFQIEPPSLYGWGLRSVQIDGPTWL
jgi:hypothetical protein